MAVKQGQSAGAPGGPGAATFRLQNQIRRNAQDMQEYLADLGQWEKSIKKRDRQIARKAAGSVSAGAVAPPLRHSAEAIPVSSGSAPEDSANVEDGKEIIDTRAGWRNSTRGVTSRERATNGSKAGVEGSTPATAASAASAASAAGHTHDKGYDKWNKFDVDAALRSVDDDGTEKPCSDGDRSSDSEADGSDGPQVARSPLLTPATLVDRSRGTSGRPGVTSHPASPATRAAATPAATPAAIPAPRDREKEERERGNALFGSGDFDEAIKCYTRCLAINNKSHLAFSNRAMASLKLREFGKAEADCSTALGLEPQHVKSLQRRATARNALGKHRAALADLQTAAEIEPSSKQIRKDLNKTLESLKAATRRAPKLRVKVESEPLPAPRPPDYPPSDAEHKAVLPQRPPSSCDDDIRETKAKAPISTVEETSTSTSSVHLETAGEDVCVSEILPDTASLGGGKIFGVEDAKRVAQESQNSSPKQARSSSIAGTVGSGSQGQTAAKAAASASMIEACGRVHASVPASVSTAPHETASARNEDLTMTTASVLCEVPNARGGLVSGRAADAETSGVSQAFVPTTAEGKKSSRGTNECASGNDATAASGERVVHDESSPGQARSGKGDHVVKLAGVEDGTAAEKSTRAKRPVSASAGPSPATSSVKQLPTTGYQFEQMWRSTEGSQEARRGLLRAVPPSAIAKMFRRTPLEVDLLEGVLENLEEALLPRRPATAVRWLKNISKASRFGMTIALVDEHRARAAVRRLLGRLKAAPSDKVDSADVDALEKLYLLV